MAPMESRWGSGADSVVSPLRLSHNHPSWLSNYLLDVILKALAIKLLCEILCIFSG